MSISAAAAPVNASAPVALIIGAGSHIGRAALSQLQAQQPDWEIVAIARHADALPAGPGIRALTTDHSDASLQAIAAQLADVRGRVQRVILCLGVLHNERLRPEKRLEDLQSDTVLEYLRINAVLPALWLKTLLPLLTGPVACSVAVLSARVGSIADNRKGGWYGYRASKAALNMLLQTTAIEYGRRAPNVSLLAYHPGTVDTPLSAPFHRSVPEGVLLQPEQTAACLLTQMDLPGTPGTARFVDYAGESVPW
jgi:NAD(P)-dependent dehydrogenase (short-subunit alcohol dehydrogenase family)